MRVSVDINKEQSPPLNGSYQEERHSDREYSSDQDLAGEAVPAVDRHHRSYTGVDLGDRTAAARAETLMHLAAIRNLSLP